MPLIKYYTPKTCYDGKRDFSPISNSRYYPDEFLIAHLLEKYRQTRLLNAQIQDKNIVVLTEPFYGNKRDGGKNTQQINQLILKAIAKEQGNNTLLLIPFLYGY